MRSQVLTSLATSLLAIPVLAAPLEEHDPSLGRWYEDLGADLFARCEWKDQAGPKGEELKLVHCVNCNQVPEGAAVAGPMVGDYDVSKQILRDIEQSKLPAGHVDTLKSKSTYQLALNRKTSKTSWMACTTASQNSRYFGGHNSYCSKYIEWADIPAGQRVLGLGKKSNTTDPPKLPTELGQEAINGGPPEKQRRGGDPPISPDTLSADQDEAGNNYGRYKYINGTTYILAFRQQSAFTVMTWSGVPMGAYVYNVGFKSTAEEPVEENPWVDHCVHISCLRCEQKGCDEQFAVTIPGTTEEKICHQRDDDGLCSDWQYRENDLDGQKRLCAMGIRGFCWD